MIKVDTLQTLAQHLDFEFNPDVCAVSKPNWASRYPRAAIAEVGETRYADFVVEPHKRPSYSPDRVSGVVEENLDWQEEQEWANEAEPDDAHDKTLHGLIEDRKGYIALYSEYNALDNLYSFELVNGANGANAVHQLLGRTPSVDIPEYVTSKANLNPSGIFTAGQITENIAEMKMLVPNVNDFYFTRHDLGTGGFYHGPSWPNTTPVIYRHLSKVAQDVVKENGGRIHCTEAVAGGDARPQEVVVIAKALDDLIARVKPSIDALAVAELRIRDGRYDTVSDAEIAHKLLWSAFGRARTSQSRIGKNLLAVTPETPDSERDRRGYWIGMQLEAGVIDTRLALHEVRPHPEATDAQTLRALNILHILKTEYDRRFADNKDQLLVA
jgi:hypothetical protein